MRYCSYQLLLIEVTALLSSVISVLSLHEAFTINTMSHGICYIPKMKSLEHVGFPTAIACPPYYDDEKKFNLNRSHGKKSLFVRELFDNSQNFAEKDFEICESPYAMSALYHKNTGEFHFGYELYYLKNKSTKLDEMNHGEYDSVDKANSWYNLLHTYALSHILSKPKLFLDDKAELGFIAIVSFRVVYDFKLKRLAQIKYQSSRIPHEKKKCDDYDLAKEFYNGVEIDKLYEEENQKKIFEGIKLPTQDSEDEYKEAKCEFENKCLTKWQLIPENQFYFHKANSLSCSNLVTVPIWKSTTQKLLHKLDIFLEAISKVVKKNLTILSGVHGVLALPYKTAGYIWKTKNINLNGKETPVPNIIYKIVEYNLVIGEEDDRGEKNFSFASKAIIVIIHNNPYVKEEDKICKNQCINWSWKEILYEDMPEEGNESKYIYCCPKNSQTIMKLGLKDDQTETDEIDLDNFPIIDHKYKSTKYKSILKPVMKIFNELFGRKNNSDSSESAEPDLQPSTPEYEQPELKNITEDVPDLSNISSKGDEERSSSVSEEK